MEKAPEVWEDEVPGSPLVWDWEDPPLGYWDMEAEGWLSEKSGDIPPEGFRLEDSFEEKIHNNFRLLDGFNLEKNCEACGKGDWVLRVTPLVRKGTAPLQLYLRECQNCLEEVEVDKWGRIPAKKDAECQVEPEKVDLISEGYYVPIFGRNTAEYRKSVVKPVA